MAGVRVDLKMQRINLLAPCFLKQHIPNYERNSEDTSTQAEQIIWGFTSLYLSERVRAVRSLARRTNVGRMAIGSTKHTHEKGRERSRGTARQGSMFKRKMESFHLSFLSFSFKNGGLGSSLRLRGNLRWRSWGEAPDIPCPTKRTPPSTRGRGPSWGPLRGRGSRPRIST